MNILIIGQDPSAGGGMIEVQNALLRRAPELDTELKMQFLATSGRAGNSQFIFFSGLARLIVFCFSKSIDLVHINMASRGSAIRKSIISKVLSFFGVPYILHVHSGEFSIFYSQQPKIIKHIIKNAIFSASNVVFLSDAMLEWCKNELGVTRAVVVRNGCRDINFGGRQKCRDRDILFLGRVNKKKGIDDLLVAIKSVSNLIPDITATIAGDGDIKSYLEMASLNGIENRVIFLGWVDRKACDNLLLTHKVFVLPSYYEGMPMSILEAMSAGIPVISTNVGGVPEVIDSGVSGILINPGDVNALSEAILLLMKNKLLWDSVAINARSDYDELLSEDIMVRRFISLYRSINKNNKI